MSDAVPVLLERLETDPDPETWASLWDELYHGAADPEAGALALPRLLRVAEFQPTEAIDAVVLAGRLSAAAWPAPKESQAEVLEALRDHAKAQLAEAGTDIDTAYLIAALLGLGQAPEWGELFDGVELGGYELTCPECARHLTVRLPSTGTEDWLSADTNAEPAPEEDLTGTAEWAYRTAVESGSAAVAGAVRELFGEATCPHCATLFVPAERVLAQG